MQIRRKGGINGAKKGGKKERIQSKQKHKLKMNKRKEHFRNEAFKETICVG